MSFPDFKPMEGVPFAIVESYAGDMRMMVSPRMKVFPIFRFIAPPSHSSASSRTVLMWMSNAFSVPMIWSLFFSSMMTLFPRASLSASSGLA